MEKIRLGVLFLMFWLLLPRVSWAEEFLYLPITRTPVITVGFCGYRNPSGSCHGGIDYDVRDDGDGIFAAAAGTVEVAEDGWANTLHRRRVYGNYVQVRHDNGYRTLYGHLKIGTLEVRTGDEVRAGQLLGVGDNSGWSTGSHLHFEVRDASGRKVDPYGESPSYPNCGANRLWVNCPPTVRVDEDSDGDTWTVEEGDCDDTNVDIHPGVRDICDYLDNDCDGATDEGFGLIGEPCARWVLECRVEGVFVCSADGLGEECDFSPPLIEAERCDGIDNNCDGATDEDWPWLGVACESGFGECRTSGAWVCEPLFELSTFCDAHVPLGSPEICDGLDNDCDTETDEDWPELGSACGIYPCDGTYVCSLGGSGSYCNSDPGMPEVCDGLDNDCDGETDEYPAELSCADTSDCTEDICLFGLCQNVARDRDHDTYTDDLCGGSDCNDLNPAVWEYTFFESRLTNFPGDSSVPVLVWTGAELGVAWEDWRESTSNAEIYFARADTTLTRIGDEVRVTNAPWQSRGPSLVWSGSEYGIAWMDYRDTNDVYFARLDVVGSKIGSETSVTDRLSFPGYSYNPALAWTGSEFGLSFLDNRVRPIDIYFIRLNSDGMAIAPEAPVVSDSWTENNPVLVWTGTQYGLAYTVSTDGYQQVFFVRIDSSGGRIGGVTSVAEFDSLGRLYAETVDLVWQGSEFALVWTKNMASGTKEAYFRRLDATGVPLAPEVLVASSSDTIYSVALVWTGSEYGLTCSASSTSLARAHFVRLDRNGASFGSEIELSSNQRISEKVAVVWIGHEHVMAWSDNRDGDWEIYLGRVGCGW